MISVILLLLKVKELDMVVCSVVVWVVLVMRLICLFNWLVCM